MPRPTFLILGAAKCGTTALARFLQDHPQVHLPYKEPSYFSGWGTRVQFHEPLPDPQPPRGRWATLDAYEQLFAGAGQAKAIGEASVSYLPDADAPALIRATVPDVRLVAFLRQPVDRAFSHFVMNRRERREPESDFRRAMESEPQRMADRWTPYLCYAHLGRYSEQVRRYRAQFPADQFRVYLYEDWDREPERVWAELMPFLGLDAAYTPDFRQRYNEAGLARPGYERLWQGAGRLKQVLRPFMPRRARRFLGRPLRQWALQRPTLDAELRQALTTRYFRDDILALQAEIGRDLSSWL